MVTNPTTPLDDPVAFYLIQERTHVEAHPKTHPIVQLDLAGPGKISTPALRITFPRNASLEEPAKLLVFGSDPHKCDVILTVGDISPVHCTLYAQLNSGPRAWIVQDHSTTGTKVALDGPLDGAKSGHIVISQRRRVLEGVRGICIGQYVFICHPPTAANEIAQRDNWFNCHQSIPVRSSMLNNQLNGSKPEFIPVRKLGSGGNGQVYSHLEMNTGLLVAVKQIPTPGSFAVHMARKEISFMKRLQHTNIVQYLIDDQPSAEKYCIMMPQYKGSLLGVLGRLELSAIESATLQVVEGLQFMHKEQVLHRDIKPENILIRRRSPLEVVIGDLGWAANLNDKQSLTGMCGTIGFCAPEAARLENLHTTAIDVYSLGATMFNMLEPWWFGEDYIAVIASVNRRPPSIYTGLIQQMLAHDPDTRVSLDECSTIITSKNYQWTQWTSRLRQSRPKPIAPKLVMEPRQIRQTPSRASKTQAKLRMEAQMTSQTPSRTPKPQAKVGMESPQTCQAPVKAAQPQNNGNKFTPVIMQQPPAVLNEFKAWKAMANGRRQPSPPTQNPLADRQRCLQSPHNTHIGLHTPSPPIQTPTHLPNNFHRLPPAPEKFSNMFLNPRKPPPIPNTNPPLKPIQTPLDPPPAYSLHPPSTRPTSSSILRTLRRHPARRALIHRRAAITKRIPPLLNSTKDLILNPHHNNLPHNLKSTITTALGLTANVLALCFWNVPRAARALRWAASAKRSGGKGFGKGGFGLGLGKEERVMYGLREKGVLPMGLESFERERGKSLMRMVRDGMGGEEKIGNAVKDATSSAVPAPTRRLRSSNAHAKVPPTITSGGLF